MTGQTTEDARGPAVLRTQPARRQKVQPNCQGQVYTPWPKTNKGDSMDTITFTHQGQTFNVPVVVAFGPNGKPVDLLGDVEPENCDHAGACWSSNLDMRCPRCGSRLFLPPRFLARRSEEAIETMHALWVRAGWPEFIGGQAARWNMRPEYWTVIPHPLFAHVGGLAVRNERLDSFPEARPCQQ